MNCSVLSELFVCQAPELKKARVEKRKRAEKLGRIWEPKDVPETTYPVKFKAKSLVQKYEDPYKQAEYAYSLIESEV